MVLVVFIKTGYDRLDGQVGETESCGGKYVSNAGVHVLIVTWIHTKVSVESIRAHNVGQVILNHQHLKQKDSIGFGYEHLLYRMEGVSLSLGQRIWSLYLLVATNNFPRLLIEGFATPAWVDHMEGASQSVVLPHK